MANYKNLKPGQIVNWQAAHGDEEFEISEVTARSFRDEWDMLSEYAGSAA